MRISDWSSDVCSSDLERKPISKPGSSFIPPRLTKHQGFMLTSASRTGSQKPMAIPGRSPQRQSGRTGLSGSGRLEGQIFSPPTEIGNRQDQQNTVIGVTQMPGQRPGPASAGSDEGRGGKERGRGGEG